MVNKRSKLLSQVFGTYFWLRVGLLFLGILFPILLWAWGKLFFGLPLQGSMSEYYWAPIDGGELPVRDWFLVGRLFNYWASIDGGEPPVRALFVGGLFAIGSFLFIYKGYTPREDWVLNAAAVLVILVALFPMGWNCGSECPMFSAHYVFAVCFFLCLWYVAIFEARNTLKEFGLGDQLLSAFFNIRLPDFFNIRLQRLFNILYWIASVCFLVPLVVLVLHWWLDISTRIFWLELGLTYAFVLFWLFKTLEMYVSQAETQTLTQTLNDAKRGRTRVEETSS